MGVALVERPEKYNFSENEIRYKFLIDNPEVPANRVRVTIWQRDILEDAGANIIDVVDVYPDADGNVYLYVQDYLKSFLTASVPDPNGDIIQNNTTRCRRFYISYFQFIDGESPEEAIYDPVRFVILGGIEKIRASRSNYFTDYLPAEKKFLTWYPGNRFVFSDQKIYLSYLHLGISVAKKLVIDIVFTDGSINQMVTDFSEIGNNILYDIEVGADDLELGLIDLSKKIFYYEITIKDDFENPIAGPYRLYIEYRPLYDFYDFIYVNSLGGMDACRVIGQVVRQLDKQVTDVETIPDYDAWLTESLKGQFQNPTVIKKDVYKGDVGFLKSKEEQLVLTELIISKKIMALVYQRWAQVVSIQRGQDYGSNQDKKFGFSIEWQFAYADAVYTPAVNLPLAISCAAPTGLINDGGTGGVDYVDYVVGWDDEDVMKWELQFGIDFVFPEPTTVLLDAPGYTIRVPADNTFFWRVRRKCNNGVWSSYTEGAMLTA